MWDAMRDAPLGWATLGNDPSVTRLQEMAAGLTGKEEALFVLTGSMGDLTALMSHARPGERMVLEASCHIARSEEWNYGSVCSLTAHPIDGPHGCMDPEAVRAAIGGNRLDHRPRTCLLCLENTHNMAGGTTLTVSQTKSLATVAHEYGVSVHLDGARLFNASVALGVEISDLAAPVDSLVLSLNKGLSAPGGALLCGSSRFIQKARLNLKKLGGHSMHQAGILAAAGYVALTTMIPRLAADHRRARLLAGGLQDLPGVSIDMTTVQTNIVITKIEGTTMTAETVARNLAGHGVRAFVYGDNVLRFVTHRHVTDADVERTVEAMRCLMS